MKDKKRRASRHLTRAQRDSLRKNEYAQRVLSENQQPSFTKKSDVKKQYSLEKFGAVGKGLIFSALPAVAEAAQYDHEGFFLSDSPPIAIKCSWNNIVGNLTERLIINCGLKASDLINTAWNLMAGYCYIGDATTGYFNAESSANITTVPDDLKNCMADQANVRCSGLSNSADAEVATFVMVGLGALTALLCIAGCIFVFVKFDLWSSLKHHCRDSSNSDDETERHSEELGDAHEDAHKNDAGMAKT